MSLSFDPYHKWLGIPPPEQPPHHYRLLGISLFEADPDVIEAAADQRMIHLRSFQAGQHSALSQRLLNETAAAKLCLLRPDRKAKYDEILRQQLAAQDVAAGDRGRRAASRFATGHFLATRPARFYGFHPDVFSQAVGRVQLEIEAAAGADRRRADSWPGRGDGVDQYL